MKKHEKIRKNFADFIKWKITSIRTLKNNSTKVAYLQITHQRSQISLGDFEDFVASNGIAVEIDQFPEFNPVERELFLRGSDIERDNRRIKIPLSDLYEVEQALKELNAHMKRPF